MQCVVAGCAALPPGSPAAGGCPYYGTGHDASRQGIARTIGFALQPLPAEAETSRLRVALMREVPSAFAGPGLNEHEWIASTRAALDAGGHLLSEAQLIVVVDRNPAVQELAILVAGQDRPWSVIGGGKVSTGQAGRRGYYLTPTGVFPHTDAILDYRAEGTFNQNHIRGLGVRGMRVWDFGWQQAAKGWRTGGEQGEIRLLLHATDPDVLEPRLGRPASQGCVRISAAMNRFLDRHGILDADYERAAAEDGRYAAVLLPDRDPSPLAGRMLVVIDSSRPHVP